MMIMVRFGRMTHSPANISVLQAHALPRCKSKARFNVFFVTLHSIVSLFVFRLDKVTCKKIEMLFERERGREKCRKNVCHYARTLPFLTGLAGALSITSIVSSSGGSSTAETLADDVALILEGIRAG